MRGTISTTTRLSIAPAAKANEIGSSPPISSTARKAITAPTGCGRLVATAAQNWAARLKPASAIGIATLVPSGMFWMPIASDDEEAEAGGLGGVGGADREALGQAVDEEHGEDEDRGAQRLAPQPADVEIVVAERAARDDEEGDACGEPDRDVARRALVERRDQQAEDGGHRHHPAGKSPESGCKPACPARRA